MNKALAEAAYHKEYMPCAGYAPLQDAILEYYSEHHGFNVDDYEVLIALAPLG